ncbi:MAG: D-tyrosyl-tRNA(Tyr) deacylase [Methanosphaera sp. rholeuAM130]|nr:MAG: D-tyrosyl-tRNA(Tyr) deacylase [Methanosphaera sp. rholeuAM130]
MKLIVQRVTKASVEVDDEIVGKIDEGFMVLVGFGVNDTKKEADYLCNKLLKLRIFEDDNDRMNLSLLDTDNELLLIPQFTLYASTKKHRPSFHKSMNPIDANELFDYFSSKCNESIHVERGIFGAHMNVSLVNNGPVTICLEKEYEE